MCGIFGQIGSQKDLSGDQIKSLGLTIKHRGPDDAGWSTFKGGFLANQRLSIIDIENGKQPFTTQDGKFTLVQNGEIYNYRELAETLKKTKGVEFETSSDSEVLLHQFAQFGVEGLKDLNGMFCFAVRDNQSGKVFVVRDRVGIKPCFFMKDQNGLSFSSEMRVLLAMDQNGEKPEISEKSMHTLLTLGYFPPPFTIYESIHQLRPGHYLEIEADGSYQEKKWWFLPKQVEEVKSTRSEIIDHVDDLIDQSVKLRTVADVPVGSYLSGGLDSTWVSLYLQKHSTEKLNTFTLTFPGTSFDESKWALEASEKIGTNHYERAVSPDDLHNWDKFIYFCEQPHCDVSFIPTYLVSELAAKHVKVVLTGDGGDEVFGGYNRYKEFFALPKTASNDDIIKLHLKHNRMNSKEQIVQMGLISNDMIDSYEEQLVNYYRDLLEPYSKQDNLNRALLIDVFTLLPGNNLVKPDRMGMAHSIEARTPLLDPRLLDYLFKLPGEIKASHDETRTLQKDILKKYFSDEFVDRDKHMLTVPITDWKSKKDVDLLAGIDLNGDILKKFNKAFYEEIKAENKENPHAQLKNLRLLNSITQFEKQFR
jgi:asparagine synthase (glutamine-hydrolysing)